jgi:hypothetical protein
LIVKFYDSKSEKAAIWLEILDKIAVIAKSLSIG